MATKAEVMRDFLKWGAGQDRFEYGTVSLWVEAYLAANPEATEQPLDERSLLQLWRDGAW